MSRVIRNILILCPLSLLLCLTSCRPNGILHSGEMREVLVDLHKTDAMIQLAGAQFGHEEAKRIYYAQVLEKHGITQAEFDSSLVWYTAHPQLFDKIYPKVIAQLNAEEEVFLAQHEQDMKVHPEGITAIKKKKKAQRTFTQEQMDSTLWVAQHGYPSMWNIRPTRVLMHNPED